MSVIFKALLDKNILCGDTVITAQYKIKDCLGRLITQQDDFTISEIIKLDNDYKLSLKKMIGDTCVSICPKDVLALDGMKIDRYIEVYNINPDGTFKQTGKKRGRKPKQF